MEVLATLLDLLLSGRELPLDEPFLPMSARFEQLDPGERLADWLLASALEQQEKLAAFSSFYAPPEQSLARLELIEKLGFGSEEMGRRLALVREVLRESGRSIGAGAS